MSPKDKITMDTKVRDKMSLGVPTDAGGKLSHLFFDQIRTLEGISNNFKLPEAKVCSLTFLTHAYAHITRQNSGITLWTKCKGGTMDTNHDVITITFPPKYAVSCFVFPLFTSSSPLRQKPKPTTKLQKRQSDMDIGDSRSS